MEIHLFIVWEKARNREDEIIQDIGKKFQILDVYQISWSKNKFSENLTRFYGTNLPKNSHKEIHCGNGEFILLIVRDSNPNYKQRKTSKGTLNVNINTFDAKAIYRKWTGGGHKIHSSNNTNETRHDITLLLGPGKYEEYNQPNIKNWDNNALVINRDIIGANGWISFDEFFVTINEISEYVILRNFEGIPESYLLDNHGDIDVLCLNHEDFVYITNAKKVNNRKYRANYTISINEQDVPFDIRYLGDGYYDKNWQLNILKERVLFKDKKFYVPDLANYYFSLLYHAAVHKRVINRDYVEKLSGLATSLNINSPHNFQDRDTVKTILKGYLSKNRYKFAEPYDLSVYLNRIYAGRFSYSLRRILYTLAVRKRKGLNNKITKWFSTNNLF